VTSLGGHKKGRAPIGGGRVHTGARLHQDLHHVQMTALGGEEKGRGSRKTTRVRIGALIEQLHYAVCVTSGSSQDQWGCSILEIR